jgi:hypothetical protein
MVMRHEKIPRTGGALFFLDRDNGRFGIQPFRVRETKRHHPDATEVNYELYLLACDIDP